MRRAVFLLALLVLITDGTPVLADGKFYRTEWTESIPPEVPYQRAMLLFDGERETLIVQSKYRTSRATGDAFGWVVPVPSVPELASMDLGLADSVFAMADRLSSPEVMRVSDLYSPDLLMAVSAGAVLMLFASLLSLLVRRMPFVPQHRAALVAGAVLMLLPVLTPLAFHWIDQLPMWAGYGVLFLGPVLALLVLLLCVLSPSFSRLQWLKGSRGILVASALLSLLALPFSFLFFRRAVLPVFSESAGVAVEVINTERVGIYDVQVVKAAEAEEMIEWFDESGFRFDDTDLQVIEDYLGRGWVFVTARVDPGAQEPADEALVAPLIMRFQAEAPVYPLALTSTAGRKTEILLYLSSQHKWTSQGRLRLWYAGGGGGALGRLAARVEWWNEIYPTKKVDALPTDPPGFFGDDDRALPYLCKFKGTLSPEQMAQDLVFTRAENEKPYRRHITIW